METLLDLNRTRISLERWPGMLQPVFGGLDSEAASELHLMNVTLKTAHRRDGHPAVYNVQPMVPVGQRADLLIAFITRVFAYSLQITSPASLFFSKWDYPGQGRSIQIGGPGAKEFFWALLLYKYSRFIYIINFYSIYGICR
jgi:hypothetical protein